MISVIIPVYNAAPYLLQAVDSALQIAEVHEILLVEDASTDGSLKICEEIVRSDGRVKLVQHPDKKNHGAGASRNLGLALASSELIAFLDADDHFLPHRFEQDLLIFKNEPETDGVYGAIGVHYHDEVGKQQFQRTVDLEITTINYRILPQELFNSLLFRSGVGHFSLDALTLRKRSLQKLTHFFNEDLRLHQDTDFIMRASYYLRLSPGSIEEPVTLRGVHRTNRITTNADPSLSNTKLYASLCDWAKSEALPIAAQKRLREKYIKWRSGTIKTFKDKLRWSMEMVQYRGLLKSFPVAEAYFNSITGKGTWLTGILIKIAIRGYVEPQ